MRWRELIGPSILAVLPKASGSRCREIPPSILIVLVIYREEALNGQERI